MSECSDPIYLTTTPIGFTESVLGLSLYGWQDRTIAPLEFASGPDARRIKIACLAPNGAGKDDRIIASVAHYWLAVHKRGKVVITSKDSKQINEQTVPAISKHVHRFEGYSEVYSPYYKLTTSTGGSLHAFVTNDASRLEGWHKENDNDGPLLFILNEAKSIDASQYEAVYRCTWNALMLISSGGPMMGDFFEAFNKHRDSFICVQAGLQDCPHIPREKVADIISTYGEDHPLTRSTVYGEFMQQSDTDDFAISFQGLSDCLINPPKHKSGELRGFCDFGAGRAEHVLATRDGNKVEIAAAWIEANKNAVAGRFIREFIKAGFSASKASEQLSCDASDKEVWQLLKDAGWCLHRQNFGGPPRLKHDYRSWSAEAWIEGGITITKGEVILPDDDVLKKQLTTRKKGITATGKLYVEDKFEMEKRNLPSPDRADAVLGVMAMPEPIVYKNQFDRSEWREVAERAEPSGVLASIGADAGW